jgi:transcriptional regulator with PAS, ATPase and Fis domain
VSCGEGQEAPGGVQSGQLQGWIEGAAGGTVFLDEVDRLSPQLQSQLLSLLEGGSLRVRSAAGQSSRRPVRIIAGVSRPIADDVVADRFNLVLYYRLNVIHIQVPSDIGLADAPAVSHLM